ncbi:unnamed protein product [Bemisia tabaci]|uniref:D-2-hydroxyglutarate dehydrogenase, mitochondrial n=1 Tax=Bemisia tabaci TaxID=7038 RepID=A0A9P0A5R4_BEMTA|nr:PREDICTED: D-2-hydroxyglutarate dehydrogenase, mitochondrial [Bemisia tabaci]CAH0383943.1 unnamed protein product [Bemisia tabaci]
MKLHSKMFSQFVRQLTTNSCNHQSVPLTKVRYPHLKRGQYAEISEKHIQMFERIVSKNQILTDPSDVEPYNIDWLKMVCGYSSVVLKPRNTEEVSEILKFCNDENIAVCPQGGRTGVVGGSVPVFDEVIVSTQLMNKIISIDPITGVLICQAGCVLENLDSALNEKGLTMPLDLGAKGSCHIGGNVSTNAGGIRYLRYGSLHGNVLGIEAVKADGKILDCLGTMKKDNTGYHLKNLFIGSEGTLGLVTKVAIKCPPKPKAVNVAFIGLESFENILSVFQLAKSELAEVLSAFEMMDAPSMHSVVDVYHVKSPVEKCPFYALIETSGSNASHDEEKLTSFLEKGMAEGLIIDGTVTGEPSRMLNLWQLREGIPEAILHSKENCYVYKYDISLPPQQFYQIVDECKKRLEGKNYSLCCGYGHVGDCNLHLNVSIPEYSPEITNILEPFVFEWTAHYGGSISAEHGIGFKKTQYLHLSKTAESIEVMRQLKQVFDPKGILNPYKVLPDV